MNEPQVWVLIGVFASIMLGAMTVMITMFNNNLNTRFTGLENAFASGLQTVDERFERIEVTFGARLDSVEASVNARLDSVEATVNSRLDSVSERFVSIEKTFEARIDSLSNQITHLDRDVQAITRYVFGEDKV